MKQLNLIFSLLLLITTSSCGVDADKKDAGNSLVARRTFLNLSSVEEIGFDKIDKDIRSTTILIYPEAKDLDSFEYSPTAGDETEQWLTLKESLSYGDKLNTTIPKAMSSFDKRTQIVNTIIAAGHARDKAFLGKMQAKEKLTILEVEKADLTDGIKKELKALGRKTKKKVCYYQEKPAKGEKYICQLTFDDVFLEDNDRKARNCKKFLEHEYINVTEEERVELDTLKTDCINALQREEEIDVLEESIADQIAVEQVIETKNGKYRDAGKSVVVELLEAVQDHTPEVFLTTGAEKEKGTDTGPYSRLGFAKDDNGTTIINELLLRLDLGLNYSEGAGAKEYSLANGKIQDLKYYQRSALEKVLEFKIITSDFVIEAELFESIQNFHGLRYVGDLIVRYPDGSTREGVGKIEVPLLN